MIPPPGEGLCRKADDQVPCDQAAIFPSKNGRAGRYSPSLGANDVAQRRSQVPRIVKTFDVEKQVPARLGPSLHRLDPLIVGKGECALII